MTWRHSALAPRAVPKSKSPRPHVPLLQKSSPRTAACPSLTPTRCSASPRQTAQQRKSPLSPRPLCDDPRDKRHIVACVQTIQMASTANTSCAAISTACTPPSARSGSARISRPASTSLRIARPVAMGSATVPIIMLLHICDARISIPVSGAVEAAGKIARSAVARVEVTSLAWMS